MDLVDEVNMYLLKADYTGASANYWDLQSSTFLKFSVEKRISKRTAHMANCEAKAREKAGRTYRSEEGTFFKKYISLNRNAVEQFANNVDSD